MFSNDKTVKIFVIGDQIITKHNKATVTPKTKQNNNLFLSQELDPPNISNLSLLVLIYNSKVFSPTKKVQSIEIPGHPAFQ